MKVTDHHCDGAKVVPCGGRTLSLNTSVGRVLVSHTITAPLPVRRVLVASRATISIFVGRVPVLYKVPFPYHFSERHFLPVFFLNRNHSYFDSYFTNWTKGIIGWGNMLTPSRRQAINWTYVNQVHWNICVIGLSRLHVTYGLFY